MFRFKERTKTIKENLRVYLSKGYSEWISFSLDKIKGCCVIQNSSRKEYQNRLRVVWFNLKTANLKEKNNTS